MKTGDDKVSRQASKLCIKKLQCQLYLTKHGARIQLIDFESCVCTDMEIKFTSFTGESASGVWGIEKNTNYLWGTILLDMCWYAIKENLEYEGTIPIIYCFAQ